MNRSQSSGARITLSSASGGEGKERRSDGAWSSVVSPWVFTVVLLLLAWGLRLCCLETVPPGWRDDELINIHALSGELFEGRFPLYFIGASGHEPLYHYLLAGAHAVLGFNVLSGHVVSVFCGVLTVALTYTLARRLFGRGTAMVASLALTTSFWSLMYSRTAIRHINLPPCALVAFYLLWRSLTDGSRRTCAIRMAPSGECGCAIRMAPSAKWACAIRMALSRGWGRAVLLGLAVGVCLYIYPAARLLPVHLVLILAYLALFHRRQFKRQWRGFLLALAVTALLAVPLWVAIGQGRSEAAMEGIGADARLDELAVPLRELRAGNPRPFLESFWTTLGMFHATGDSEWLYNIAGRPVFNLLGGALLWAGVLFCLYRWRRPRYFFLLSWLGLGLLPAFVSTPPASLSHTILAQPVAYILPAVALTEGYRWLRSRVSSLGGRGGQPRSVAPVEAAPRQKRGAQRSASVPSALVWSVVYGLLVLLFLVSTAVRDLRDYFTVWPRRGMVGFLYRADYRVSARYLNAHPEIADVAVSSNLLGPWDRLALAVDVHRDDVAARMFNPERALVYPAGSAPRLILTHAPEASSMVRAAIERDMRPLCGAPEPLRVFAPAAQGAWWPEQIGSWVSPAAPHSFANGLSLIGWGWPEDAPAPGRTVPLLLAWEVSRSLDLPPMPIVANPPPPGVYSGPRLAVFAHLLAADADVDRASGALLVGDDGLWVDPLTLRPGDRFFQIHLFALPPDAPSAPYTVEVGLYDPMTGERWPSDVLIPLKHTRTNDQCPRTHDQCPRTHDQCPRTLDQSSQRASCALRSTPYALSEEER